MGSEISSIGKAGRSGRFFILSKYPPSLVYILLTLGILFLILSLALHFETRLRDSMDHPLLNALNVVWTDRVVFLYCSLIRLWRRSLHLWRPVQLSLEETWGIWLLGLVPLYYFCVYYTKLKAKYRGFMAQVHLTTPAPLGSPFRWESRRDGAP